VETISGVGDVVTADLPDNAQLFSRRRQCAEIELSKSVTPCAAWELRAGAQKPARSVRVQVVVPSSTNIQLARWNTSLQYSTLAWSDFDHDGRALAFRGGLDGAQDAIDNAGVVQEVPGQNACGPRWGAN